MNVSCLSSAKNILISIAILCTASCGGSGGGSNGSTTSPGGGPDNGLQPLNPQLSGSLFYRNHNSFTGLTLNTGLEQTLLTDQAHISRSGDQLITIARPIEAPGDTDREQISIFSKDFSSVQRFTLNGNISGPVKTSTDDNYLLFYWESNTENALVIFTPNGDQIDSLKDQNGNLITSWEWIDSTNILLSSEHGLYVWNIESGGSIKPLQTSPRHNYNDVAINPTKTKIAFGYKAASDSGQHIYVADINTQFDLSNINQLTDSSLNEEDPVWSPDGNNIIFRYGFDPSFLPDQYPQPGTCPNLHMIPASQGLQQVANNQLVLKLDDDGESRDVCAFSAPSWLASDINIGGTAAGQALPSGTINPAFSERLFYRKPGTGFVYLAIETGIIHELAGDGFNIFPSQNSAEYAYEERSPDSGSFSNHQLTIRSLAGNTLDSFEVVDDLQGIPKLSYNSNYIAVEFDSTKIGDPSAANIVTVFNRSGEIINRYTEYEFWSWSPTGDLYLSNHHQIIKANPDNSLEQLVYEAPFAISDISVSPTGNDVAFTMQGHIWVLDLTTNKLRKLTTSASVEFMPAWSPTGKYLAIQQEADCNKTYMLPGNGVNIYVGQSKLGSNSRKIQYEHRSNDYRHLCISSNMSWRP